MECLVIFIQLNNLVCMILVLNVMALDLKNQVDIVFTGFHVLVQNAHLVFKKSNMRITTFLFKTTLFLFFTSIIGVCNTFENKDFYEKVTFVQTNLRTTGQHHIVVYTDGSPEGIPLFEDAVNIPKINDKIKVTKSVVINSFWNNFFIITFLVSFAIGVISLTLTIFLSQKRKNND